MKTQSQVTKDFLDHEVSLAEKDLGGPQDWGFLVPQEKGANEEIQADQARGARMAWRVRKVIFNVSCDTMSSDVVEAEVSPSSGPRYYYGRTTK